MRNAAGAAMRKIERRRSWYSGLETLFFGLSLGSVLVLAAIGLAITFGVMGVINMAHGELMMLGAYSDVRHAAADAEPHRRLDHRRDSRGLRRLGTRGRSPSSAASCAGYTAGRWKPCSPRSA